MFKSIGFPSSIRWLLSSFSRVFSRWSSFEHFVEISLDTMKRMPYVVFLLTSRTIFDRLHCILGWCDRRNRMETVRDRSCSDSRRICWVFLGFMAMFFDHHVERTSWQHWLAPEFRSLWCHSLLFVRRRKAFDSIRWISSSLRGIGNAFAFVSRCSDHGSLFSLRVHGVRQIEYLTYRSIDCFLLFFRLIAGFYSGRIYKTIKGSNWKRTAALVNIHSVRSAVCTTDSSLIVDGNVVPWHRLRRRLLLEFLHLGQTFIGSSALFNDVSHSGHVARHFISLGLCWFLLRLSQTGRSETR